MAGWRYRPPYDFYDGDPEPVRNPERFFEVRDATNRLLSQIPYQPLAVPKVKLPDRHGPDDYVEPQLQLRRIPSHSDSSGTRVSD